MQQKITRNAITVNAERLGRNIAERVLLAGMGEFSSIGARIKHARKLRGMSQEALTLACGWDYQSRLSSYERDIREPKADELRLLAKALQVSLAWLAAEEGEPDGATAPQNNARSDRANHIIQWIEHLDGADLFTEGLAEAIAGNLRLASDIAPQIRVKVGDIKIKGEDADIDQQIGAAYNLHGLLDKAQDHKDQASQQIRRIRDSKAQNNLDEKTSTK